MANYIVPEYEEIERNLVPFSKEHNLDSVTLSSMIRGSIEVLESEIPTASVAIIDADNFNSSISVKVKNLKVNIKFALNSIFSFKSVCDAEGKWLTLAILKTIVFLLEDMKVKLSPKEAIVLFCIYRLQSATPEEIRAYANRVKENNKDADIKFDDVNEALGILEKIGTIKLENGKYYLCETILIRKY